MTYHDFVKDYMGVEEAEINNNYSPAGHLFSWDTEDMVGDYWFYQSDNFIIDIHNFHVKREVLQDKGHSMADYVSIYTTYLISGNGERFNPYQTLTPNSLYSIDFDHLENNCCFLLHENSNYLGVAIGFKKDVLNKYLASIKISPEIFYSEFFLNKQSILTKVLEPIAMDILNCRMESPAAEIFFNAKANEWISVIIDTFLKRENIKISPDDKMALEDVRKYLDDHYAMNVNQKTLEKISMMSGTKLKKLFKDTYHQTIKEYTRRKRMNIAEVLLLNSNLPIKEIAESVGYSSHSKFSTYYKKYKGKFPSEVRKTIQSP